MKRFLLLLLGGFVLFMALAIADEWAFFSSAWFGSSTPTASISPPPQAELDSVVREFCAQLSECYSAAGALGIPVVPSAGPETVGELRADLMYLRHRRWTQSLSLSRLEVDSVSQISPGRVQVWTREWWALDLSNGGGESERRESKVRCLYRIQRLRGAWVVAGWDALPPGDFDKGAEDSGGSP